MIDCGAWGVCAKPERHLMDYDSVMSACGPPANANQYRRDFFNHFKNVPFFKNFDGFICAHPAAVCEMFMPFNKTLIMVLTIPFDHGRENRERFLLWRKEIQQIVKDPRNVIVSNNLYDREYMNYFTGHRPLFIPALSMNEGVKWNPIRPEFLIHQARGVLERDPRFARDFIDQVSAYSAKKKYNIQIVGNKNLYKGHYTYQQLANHRAFIVFPYIKSLMSLFEIYSMNVPFFAPSLNFLTELERAYGRVIYERTYWTKVPSVDEEAKKYEYSPLDYSLPAFKYWMKWSDFYLWKNVVLFDSFEDLCDKLMTTNFTQVHENMKKENEERKNYVFSMWEKILRRSFTDVVYKGKRETPQDFELAMMKLYNMTIPSINQGCPRESRPDVGHWTL